MGENTCDIEVASYKFAKQGLEERVVGGLGVCCKTVVCLIGRSNPLQ